MESYKSRVDYTVSDNTKVTYSFPFQYLKKKFVKVDVTSTDNTVATLTYGVDYTVTDLSITLTAALEVGKTLTIYRETDTDSIVSWNDGSILLAADMSLSDVQMLHLQEEQEDYLKTHSIRTETTAYNETVFDASSHRIHNVADPIDAQDAVTKNYMESVQSGFVQQNTALKNETTKQASAATVSATNAKTSETNSKTSETNAATSAAAAKVSETNAKTSETNAKASETNAKTSETKAATSEANAKTSETNAKTSETKSSTSASESASSASASATSATNAKTSETNAANSAKQAAESAGVFQDFKGATADTDGNGGKVPKPLAGQQDKVLKADGTWGEGVTPNTLWHGMHYYPVNYVPSDTSNSGWNSLGFCSIYYTDNKINNQPTQYGQLINIPADSNTESTQLWVEQHSGRLFSRGDNGNISVNNVPFTRYATSDEVNTYEKVGSRGGNWVRYTSGLQLCWNVSIGANASWSFPVAFSETPAVTLTARTGEWQWVDSLSNTRCINKGGGSACAIAVGRWK